MKKFSEIKYSDYKRIKDRVGRFLAVVLYNVLVSQALYLIPYMMHEDIVFGHYIPKHMLIIGIFASFFAFYSITRLVQAYNEPLKNEYLDSSVPKKTAIDKIRFFLSVKRLRICAIIFAAIYYIIPTKALHYGICTCVLGEGSAFLHRFALKTALVAIFLILAICATLTAVKSWEKEGRLSESESRKERKEYSRLIIVTPIAYIVGGVGLGFFFPYLAAFVYLLMNVKALIALVLLIVIPIIFKYLRALRIRHSFIKKLRKLMHNKKCRITKIKYPYRSAFNVYKGESFTLSVNGKRYSCKLIGAPKKNMPFALLPNGYGTFVKIFRFFKIEVYSYNKNFRYGYESDLPKILIINPISKFLYTTEGVLGERDNSERDMHIYTTGSTRNNANLKRIRMLNGEEAEFTINGGKTARLDNGDRVGDFKIFSATGFLNAIDRDCLDR